MLYSSVAWGDYDNDGDLDILLTGSTTSTLLTKVYRNDGAGIFTDLAEDLPEVMSSSVAWGDYDNDGRLDFLLAGGNVSGFVTRVYRSSISTANTAPGTPTNLSAIVGADQVTLSWTAATDGETPQAGLTYNVRLGTTTGGIQKAAPMASDTGYRRVVRPGNAGQRTTTVIKGLSPGTYYWSVQAVDGAFAGSAFATEGIASFCGSFSIDPAGVSVVAGGGGGSVNVTAGTGCGWTAVSNVAWMTVDSGSESGSGDATVHFTVAGNPLTSSRVGTLTVAGQTFTVTQAGFTLSSLTANRTFPFSPDGSTSITWTATASGAGPLEYRFVRWQQSTGATTTVQAQGTSSTYTWTPSTSDSGSYQLGVYVKDVDGHWLSMFTSLFQISGQPLGITSLTANQAFPFTVNGTAITWTAVATGSAVPLQYQFVRWQQSTNTTTVVRALGVSNTYSWTPTVSDAGFYQIGVYVRDANGHWASLFAGLFQIVGQQLSIASLTPNQAFPFTATGVTSITWTASAIGGAVPLQYQFVRWQQSTNTTTVVRALGTSNTYTWTPSPSDSGSYQVGVYVRDAGGRWASLFTTLFEITGQPLTITSLTPDQAFPFTANGVTPITWTASATGGAAPIQYRFVRWQQSTGSTTIVRALGTGTSYSWTPTIADRGFYQIGVYIRDAAGVWRSQFTTLFQIQ